MSLAAEARTSVVASFEEALDGIEDGATIGIGGAVTAAHPMALVRALAASGVKGLTVVAPTNGLDVEILIAAGCVETLISAYVGMEGAAGVAPVYRRAVEDGSVEVKDFDEAHCIAGFRAAAQKLPFLPVRGGVGTSYADITPELIPFKDPVAGEELLAVTALNLDVALIFAEAADEFGNVQTSSSGHMDQVLGAAAERVVVQVDRIVANDEIRKNPLRTWYWKRTQVVRAPFGTHPYSSATMIADADHLAEAIAAGRAGGEELDAYMKRYVHDAPDHDSYLEEIGIRRIASLQI